MTLEEEFENTLKETFEQMLILRTKRNKLAEKYNKITNEIIELSKKNGIPFYDLNGWLMLFKMDNSIEFDRYGSYAYFLPKTFHEKWKNLNDFFADEKYTEILSQYPEFKERGLGFSPGYKIKEDQWHESLTSDF